MIFVLGGEGFLGSAFMAELKKRGQSAVAVTRKNYKAMRGRRCSLFVNANGNPIKYLAEKDPALDFDLAVRSTLASLLDFKYDHYLYLSSTAVYPTPTGAGTREDRALEPPFGSRYGFHRTIAERLVRQYAARWTILRLGGLIGPGMKKGPMFDLLNGAALRVHPTSRFQFIDTRDVAPAALALARRPGVFNLAGQGAVAMSALAKQNGLVCRARPQARREIWNVSVAKAARFVKIPPTRAAVRRLVSELENTPS